MRALFINAEAKTVTEIDGSTLEGLQKCVGGYIETAMALPTKDTLFVDEDGLSKNYAFGFVLLGMPFVGNGVVVGPTDGAGDHTPARVSITALAKAISWAEIKNIPPQSQIDDAAKAAAASVAREYKANQRQNERKEGY